MRKSCLGHVACVRHDSLDGGSRAMSWFEKKVRSTGLPTFNQLVKQGRTAPRYKTASPALVEIRLNETFTGDIDGEPPVRALQEAV